MTKFRSSNNPRSSIKFRTHAPDTVIFDDVTCDSLTATGIILGDDSEIKFGNSTDLSIRHDPDLNKVSFSKQLQFNSSCASGDTFKITESTLRASKLLFTSQTAAGALKSNYVLSIGNDDTEVANRRVISESIQRQDSSGSHTFRRVTQTANDIDTVKIEHFAKTKLSNDLTVVGSIENDFASPTAAGAGFADAIVGSNISKIDNEIVTTFLIDLQQGPMKAQTAAKIIGESGSSDTCHITQVTAAKNGYVYKAELCCIEAPNAAANLDLVFAASAQAPGSTTLTVLIDGAVHNRGNCEQILFDNVNIDDKFLHLASGATDGTANYTSGKFILKLYGANF